MTEEEFTNFLTQVSQHASGVSYDGALHFICMDWRHLAEITAAGKAAYSELKNVCVWNKDNGGIGSLYRSKHELIFVFKVGTARHVNNIELGRAGRYRTNVWDYAGVNTMRADRLQDLAMHPPVKPVALVADAIKDCSRRSDIVLDPLPAPAPHRLPLRKPADGRGSWKSTPSTSMLPFAAGRRLPIRTPFTTRLAEPSTTSKRSAPPPSIVGQLATAEQ